MLKDYYYSLVLISAKLLTLNFLFPIQERLMTIKLQGLSETEYTLLIELKGISLWYRIEKKFCQWMQ